MAVVWLGLVLLLVLAVSQAARWLPRGLRPSTLAVGPGSQENALTLRGSLALDLRRRVYLVEVAGQSTLILTGGTADLMLALKQGEG